VEVVRHSYFLDAVGRQLMRYDGLASANVVLENVVSLDFEYFGEPAPPAFSHPAVDRSVTYGPAPPVPDVSQAPWPPGENCAWQMAGGYTGQNAEVTRATVAARAGAQVPQVPHHTFSLWNTYQFHPRVSGGLGVVSRTGMFAAIDNSVVLPGYVDADAALYVALTWRLRLQANVENLFDRRYYTNADSNTNISPGSPRVMRIALRVNF